MPGSMSRILRRRADGASAAPPSAPDAVADEARPAAETGEQPTTAAPAVPETPLEQATAITPAVVVEESPPAATPEVVPVDAAPEEVAPADVARPGASFRDRGKLRRRLRYLRRVRELGFRDLGGLVFDLDRFGRERPDLVELKLAGLRSIDAELRTLETALDDERPVEELSEPGISACAHCGALHGSEARFCPACGTAAGTPRFTTLEAPAAPAGEPAPADGAVPDQPTT